MPGGRGDLLKFNGLGQVGYASLCIGLWLKGETLKGDTLEENTQHNLHTHGPICLQALTHASTKMHTLHTYTHQEKWDCRHDEKNEASGIPIKNLFMGLPVCISNVTSHRAQNSYVLFPSKHLKCENYPKHLGCTGTRRVTWVHGLAFANHHRTRIKT